MNWMAIASDEQEYNCVLLLQSCFLLLQSDRLAPVGVVSKLNGCCRVRAGERREHGEIPALVLDESSHFHLMAELKVGAQGEILNVAARRDEVAVDMGSSVSRLDGVMWRQPVSAPELHAVA